MTPRRLILDVVAPRGVPSTARASTSARASCVVCAVPRACPHFPACSGCVTALDAVDALDPPVLEAVREYFGDDAHETFRGRATRWRCKAKLAARAETSSGRVALGLFKRGTHELAATETCPVSHVGVERAELMPYWDRYDEGVFVGGAGSGSAMHVDQIGWSNIGKNWTGHKLVAIWPYGAASNRALDSHLDVLFVRPSAPFG